MCRSLGLVREAREYVAEMSDAGLRPDAPVQQLLRSIAREHNIPELLRGDFEASGVNGRAQRTPGRTSIRFRSLTLVGPPARERVAEDPGELRPQKQHRKKR